jgi:Spy/CpxP family protein refolding chaperone
MSKKGFVGIGLAAVLAFGGLMAFAQTTPPAAGQTPGRGAGNQALGGFGMLAGYLDLTDAQKAQLKTIVQDAQTAVQAVNTQFQPVGQNLLTAIKANDAAGIQAAAIAVGQYTAGVTAIHANALAKFYALLTPDQKAKADQLGARLLNLFGVAPGPGAGAGRGLGPMGGGRMGPALMGRGMGAMARRGQNVIRQ